jgi:signal transduction histidine kinase
VALPEPTIALISRLYDSFKWMPYTNDPAPDCFTSSGDKCPPYFNSTQRIVVIVLMLVALALLFWLFRVIARLVLRPLHDLTGTVHEMDPQNLGQRIRASGARDELRDLADAVDDMLNRVAIGFEGQRRFAANASHELRTPLAVQRTLVEVAMTTSGGLDPDLNRLGAQLLLVNERNERLIEGLLVLAESDRGLVGTSPVHLDELVTAALTNYADLAEEHGVALRRGLASRWVSGDPILLERLISNLLHNAIKYNEPGGWVEIVVADSPALLVHNSGQQLPSEAIPALFEPFRRRVADRTNHRDGAGLGLSIVRSITAAHDGTVTAEPGTDGGLRISVDLPWNPRDTTPSVLSARLVQ